MQTWRDGRKNVSMEIKKFGHGIGHNSQEYVLWKLVIWEVHVA